MDWKALKHKLTVPLGVFALFVFTATLSAILISNSIKALQDISGAIETWNASLYSRNGTQICFPKHDCCPCDQCWQCVDVDEGCAHETCTPSKIRATAITIFVLNPCTFFLLFAMGFCCLRIYVQRERSSPLPDTIPSSGRVIQLDEKTIGLPS